MARKLAKCVALAPLDTLNDSLVDHAGDLRRADVRSFFSFDAAADGTRTSWVRVWADWYDLQELGPDKLRVDLLDALAANVEAARAAGKRVVLTSRSYPLWANGMADVAETEGDPGFDPAAPGWVATVGDRRRRAGAKVKLRRFRYPGKAVEGARSIDVGPNSAWAVWITFLAAYFNPLRDAATNLPEPYKTLLESLPTRPLAFVDHLEFVNEPNGAEMWPQLDAQGGNVAADVVAEMFRTVKGIETGLGAAPGPVFVGPATADALGVSGRMVTSVEEFTEAVLLNLKASGYVPGKRTAWSTHNYTDVTRGCWRSPAGDGAAPLVKGRKDPLTNRAQLVRAKLAKHGWAGWPKGRPEPPRILLTEGGVQRAKIRAPKGRTLDQEHARLLTDAGRRLGDEAGMGAGIDMFTHFLFYTTPAFDSGLVDVPAVPGLPGPDAVRRLKRPAYYAWRDVSETKR